MRYPIVAGTFYSSDKIQLKDSIASLISKSTVNTKINCVNSIFVPNGKYSELESLMGAAYAELFGLAENTTFVIIGPNTLKRGKPVAISQEDWITPLGKVTYDRHFAELIKQHSTFAEFDDFAHMYEPSIEIQLPFVQTLVESPKIVAISVCMSNKAIVYDLVNAIQAAAGLCKKNIMVIAACDFITKEDSFSAETETNRYVEMLKVCKEPDFDNFANLLEESNEFSNYSIFLIPLLFALRQKFSPLVAGKKIVKTGVKEQARSYLSVIYYK